MHYDDYAELVNRQWRKEDVQSGMNEEEEFWWNQ